MFNISTNARAVNVAQRYARHRPSGADRAIQLASERAAEMAARIAAARAGSTRVMNEPIRRQFEQADKISSLFHR
jgi:alkylation response protein AidB-like acyl-CoA dehydrogenase